MCQTLSGMASVMESYLCLTTITLLRFEGISTWPYLRHEPRCRQAHCTRLALPAFHTAFPEAFGPYPRQTVVVMPCHCKHLQESQPQASSLCGAWGEAGPALGPQPNICHDTQIIFVCGWQVLWLRRYLKCVVKVSIIPCSRHCGALEEQPSLQASSLLLAWIAHRLLQSCRKQQEEAVRYLHSRYVSSRRLHYCGLLPASPQPTPILLGRDWSCPTRARQTAACCQHPSPALPTEARFPVRFGELGAC